MIAATTSELKKDESHIRMANKTSNLRK